MERLLAGVDCRRPGRRATADPLPLLSNGFSVRHLWPQQQRRCWLVDDRSRFAVRAVLDRLPAGGVANRAVPGADCGVPAVARMGQHG